MAPYHLEDAPYHIEGAPYHVEDAMIPYHLEDAPLLSGRCPLPTIWKMPPFHLEDGPYLPSERCPLPAGRHSLAVGFGNNDCTPRSRCFWISFLLCTLTGEPT